MKQSNKQSNNELFRVNPRVNLRKSVSTTKGFTLMEAIVAITVITVGIVGVFSLVTQTISTTSISKNKLIAAYLAQEGIEIVRNIRDTNWLDPTNPSWDDGLGAGEYEADYDDLDLTACLSPCDYDNNLRFLKINGGFYNYASGTDTKFKRKITIGSGPPMVDSINVKVEVFWQEKGNDYRVEAQENLYNWK